jgi:hypothetical protein
MSGRYLKRYDGLSSVKAISKNVKGVFKDSKRRIHSSVSAPSTHNKVSLIVYRQVLLPC